MAGIQLPGRFTSQPQYPALVSGIGIGAGIVFAQTGVPILPFANNAVVGVAPSEKGMARTFASASAQYLSASTKAFTGFPFTFAALAMFDTLTGTQSLMSIGASTNDRHLLYKLSNNTIGMFSGPASGSIGQAATPGFVAANTWYVLIGRVHGAASRDVTINGLSRGTETTSVVPAAVSTVAIGAYWTAGAPTAGFYLNGKIALGVVWNRAITDAEVTSFVGNPWQIFQAPDRPSMFSHTAAAPSGYKPYWSSQRPRVYGAGVR